MSRGQCFTVRGLFFQDKPTAGRKAIDRSLLLILMFAIAVT